MSRITDHFASWEFDCRDGTPYPAAWYKSRLTPLCKLLEDIRRAVGCSPVRIVSGYRTKAYNRRIGGAAKSQHVLGRAADITCDHLPAKSVHHIILNELKLGRLETLGGLGLYNGFVHVDVRPRKPDGRIARWNGSRTAQQTRGA